jgi:selenocysteine lyase/cysteine desulfurase
MIDAAQIDRWRSDTPGSSKRVHLNNAGASLVPSVVHQAVVEHLELERDAGGYEAAAIRHDEIEDTYAVLAELVGARPANIGVVANATAGFVQAMSSFDFKPGDAILTSRADYTSYQIHYLALSQRLGVRVLYADELPEGGIDPDSVRETLAREKCRLVHVSWIPTHSGMVQDVAAVGSACEDAGVPFIVDACQAVGQLPIDVAALRCDYLSVTARKFLRGPRGIGFLYASDRALERGDHPLFIDMRGARWVAPDRYEIDATARRYEDWEFAYGLVLGLRAAAKYALDAGVSRCGERARELAAHLRSALREVPGITVLDRGKNLCAIVTAELDGVHAQQAVDHLSRRGINSAASLKWYGLLDFGPRGVESAVRLSPHYYNTLEEIDGTVAALADLLAS